MKKSFNLLLVMLVFFIGVASGPAWAGIMPEINYETYTNDRFGYSLQYPDLFTSPKTSDNGDGLAFETKDGHYSLTVWGGYNIDESKGGDLLKARLDEVAHIVPDSEKSGDEFYTIEYSDDGASGSGEHIFHEYGLVTGDIKVTYILKYLADDKRFFLVKQIMDSSLTLGESAGAQN